MTDQPKKPIVGSFADMMEASEKQEKRTKEQKNEISLEKTNFRSEEQTEERVLKHHSFDVFIDQLISIDQRRIHIYKKKGKKPGVSKIVQEALDEYFENHKND